VIALDRLLGHLWIVGPGRLGLAMGWQLLASGRIGRMTFAGRAAQPPEHPVFQRADASYTTGLPSSADAPTLILLTVSDGAVAEIASDLARRQLPPVPVLHTSGVLSSEVLAPLADVGHPVGSVHPLVAVAHPVKSADRLLHAWYGLEGTSAAVEAGCIVVGLLKGMALPVDPSMRSAYHAAAVFASNYVVALLAVAESLLMEAGVDEGSARQVAAALAGGAVDSVEAGSPVTALTGPVSRGDAETVALHLAGLSPELRPLYSELARTTLRIAQSRGLSPEAADRIVRMLEAASQ
jgi:predicted short-subunit dehydrogenase-like oxidoreductase (DUF2520 family)